MRYECFARVYWTIKPVLLNDYSYKALGAVSKALEIDPVGCTADRC